MFILVACLLSTIGGSMPTGSRPLSGVVADAPTATGTPNAIVEPTAGRSSQALTNPRSAGPVAKPKPKPTVKRTKPVIPPAPESVVGKPGPQPTGAPTPGPKPVTLQDYLALIPSFPAAPAPVKVPLTAGNGQAGIYDHLNTNQPVVFITIDDGYWPLPLTSGLILQSGIPVTNFLTADVVSEDIDYFAKLQAAGNPIEGHTKTHPYLTQLTYDQQKEEICDSTDELGTWFGRRPTFFRPPYLLWNDDTLRASWDCGLKIAFSADVSVDDGVVYYGYDDLKIHAGDIIVLHYNPEFPDAFLIALTAIKAAGLIPVQLEDYIDVP